MIDGNSIINGEYTPINVARAPLTISTNMTNLVGDKSITIENPTLSGVRSGIGALLSKGQDGSTAACMSFEYIDVSSEQNLKTAFGFSNNAGAEIKGGLVNVSTQIKANLNYGSTTKKNKIIVRFIQSYYTIDVDKPTSPRGFFASSLSTEELKKAMPSYSAPVYVSSMNYGRVYYVCIQSDYSASELEASFKLEVEAKIKAKVVNGNTKTDITSSVEKSTILKNSSISAVIIGGSASTGAGLLNASNLTQFTDIIVEGANWNKNNPGSPISYKLSKLADNSVFSVRDYNEFINRDCRKTTGQVSVEYFKNISGDDNDIFGTITATLGYEGEGDKQTITIWSKDRNNFCDIPSNNTEYSACGFNPSEVFNFDYEKKDKMYIRIKTDLQDNDDHGLWYEGIGHKDWDDTYKQTITTIKPSLIKQDGVAEDAKGNYIVKLTCDLNPFKYHRNDNFTIWQNLIVDLAININLLQ